MTWDEFLALLVPWHDLIFVVLVLLGAVILRLVLKFAIKRVVERIVLGVKKKQDVSSTPRRC